MTGNVTFNQLEFWIDQWNAYNSTVTAFSGYSAASTWDAMAADYGKKGHTDNIDERFDATFARLVDRRFTFNGSRILDIGCGPGRYAREFVRRGAEVVCIDISDNMIERLKSESTSDELSRMIPMVNDWKVLDLSRYKFEKAFDLVFANMTPAVTSPDSFMKLMRASRKWCWFRSWAGPRINPLLEHLFRVLYGDTPEPFSGNFGIAWNMVCAAQYFPDCVFETVRWMRKKPIDELVAFHTTFFRSKDQVPDSIREKKIRTALLEIATDDGCIENTVTGHTGSMLWRVC